MRRAALGRGGLTALLVLLLAGCAGPKRLPPIAVEPGAPPPARPAAPLLLGVGLVEAEPALELAADGPCLLLEAGSGEPLARVESGRLSCRRRSDAVDWQVGADGGTAAGVILQPLDPDHRVHWGDEAFRGEFLVRPTPGRGGLTLVNQVELEDYLRGVVPWEIGRHGRDRLAALEAQAVAARTYTVSHLGARADRGFDLFASVMDQVYRGCAGEDDLCNEAVARTAGLVLLWQDREIDAYYSACCGGTSSQVEEVWPREGRPYLVSRADAADGGPDHCAGSRYYRWSEEWTAGQLEAILQRTLPAYLDYVDQSPLRREWAGPVFTPAARDGDPRRPGRLLDLAIGGRTTGGRVADLAVTTAAGTYHVRGDRTRWVLEPAGGQPEILRSARFDLELRRDGRELRRVVARGRGFGHGIGLCQEGALEMARRGSDFREILAHYYPGTRLRTAAEAGERRGR